jgi:hypothetical protein
MSRKWGEGKAEEKAEETVAPAPAAEEKLAADLPAETVPISVVVSLAAKDRIVDLCRHVSRTDPGEGRKLAQQILADLGVE